MSKATTAGEAQQDLYVGAEDDEVICPTLHHLGIFTTRFEEMREFYAIVLGMKPILETTVPLGNGDNTMMRISFLTNDHANHRITLVTYDDLKDIGRRGYARAGQHMAFEYKTIDDLFRTYKRLKRLGIKLGTCDAHGVSTSIYLPDPDANIIELRIDNFGDWNQSSEYMRSGMTKTGPYGANPRGAGSVDFDKMITARDQGATIPELFERAFNGEFKPATPPDLTFQL